MMVGDEPIALERYKSQIEAALSYSNASHRYEDVAAMVDAGTAQFWPGPSSVIITETVDFPRKRALHFFLAGGTLPELEAMIPLVLDWGKANGCSHSTFIGRRGWLRTFVTRLGWHDTGLVVMEKSL